jgi:hypothetical protein
MFYLLYLVLLSVNSLPFPCHTHVNTCIEDKYYCGNVNSIGQDTIVQCIQGQYVFIDNCDGNYTTCKYINDIPYCV